MKYFWGMQKDIWNEWGLVGKFIIACEVAMISILIIWPFVVK